MMRVRTTALDFASARPILQALALSAALSGCAGSGGSPASPAPPTGGTPELPSGPTVFPSANAATGGGHWWGVLSRGSETVHSAMCLLVEAGELACVLGNPAERQSLFARESMVGALHGTLKVSSTTTATGSGKIYATPGKVLTDGTSVVADFTITGGKLYDGNRLLEFTYTSLGVEYTFNGFYDHYYATEGEAFVWPADGVYPDFDIYGDPASLSIDQDGALFLQTASGCSGNGQMINIEPTHRRNTPGYNAYTVDVTMSNCAGLNGVYEGLATLIDFSWVNGTNNLVIAVFNETTAIVGEAVSQ